MEKNYFSGISLLSQSYPLLDRKKQLFIYFSQDSSIMKKYLLVLFLVFFLSSCTNKDSNITLSSRENPQEGLNIFNVSEEYGLIEGAYLEGEYRVDFEARRGALRPLMYLILDPKGGLYDHSGCFIAKNGDPFIIVDSCSVPSLCLPTDDPESEKCQIDEQIRTKEFELAEKAGQEMKNLSFPNSLNRNVEVLTSAANILSLTNFAPASSAPNNQKAYP